MEQSHALQLSYFKPKFDEPFQAQMGTKTSCASNWGEMHHPADPQPKLQQGHGQPENDPDLAAVFDGSLLGSLSMLSLRNKIDWLDASKTMCVGSSCGSYLLLKIKS